MNIKKIIILSTLSLLILSCSKADSTKEIKTNTHKTASMSKTSVNLPSYSDSIVNKMLINYNANDFNSFKANFDKQMLEAMTKEKFVELKEAVNSSIGKWLSINNSVVTSMGDYILVKYKADFEKEKNVEISIVYNTISKSNTPVISGFVFNSPKLNASQSAKK